MEAKTNEEFFNVSALIDERFVRKELLLVRKQKKKRMLSTPGKLSKTQGKRLRLLKQS